MAAASSHRAWSSGGLPPCQAGKDEAGIPARCTKHVVLATRQREFRFEDGNELIFYHDKFHLEGTNTDVACGGERAAL
eukprot:14167485-Alexandrium_andersonii.AAC.1